MALKELNFGNKHLVPVADPSCKNIMSFFFYIICRTYCWVFNFEHIRGMNDGVIYFLVIDMEICVGRQTFLLKKI